MVATQLCFGIFAAVGLFVKPNEAPKKFNDLIRLRVFPETAPPPPPPKWHHPTTTTSLPSSDITYQTISGQISPRETGASLGASTPPSAPSPSNSVAAASSDTRYQYTESVAAPWDATTYLVLILCMLGLLGWFFHLKKDRDQKASQLSQALQDLSTLRTVLEEKADWIKYLEDDLLDTQEAAAVSDEKADSAEQELATTRRKLSAALIRETTAIATSDQADAALLAVRRYRDEAVFKLGQALLIHNSMMTQMRNELASWEWFLQRANFRVFRLAAKLIQERDLAGKEKEETAKLALERDLAAEQIAKDSRRTTKQLMFLASLLEKANDSSHAREETTSQEIADMKENHVVDLRHHLQAKKHRAGARNKVQIDTRVRRCLKIGLDKAGISEKSQAGLDALDAVEEAHKPKSGDEDYVEDFRTMMYYWALNWRARL